MTLEERIQAKIERASKLVDSYTASARKNADCGDYRRAATDKEWADSYRTTRQWLEDALNAQRAVGQSAPATQQPARKLYLGATVIYGENGDEWPAKVVFLSDSHMSLTVFNRDATHFPRSLWLPSSAWRWPEA